MKKWLKLVFVIMIFAAISVALFFILKLFGLTNITELKEVVTKSGKYGFIVYTLALIVMLVAFCFMPFLNTAMSILGIALFGSKIAFITNLIAIFCSSSILFFIGDKLGEKFASRLIGKNTLEETQNLIDHKSKFWLPILFIAPGIPDEAICLVSGMTKIKYWYLLIVSLCYHALELGVLCFFGSGLINWATLSLIDWILVANIILIDLFLLIKFEKYLDNKIKNRKN